MTDTVISARHLSKRYTIRMAESRADNSLREDIAGALRRPFARRARRRELTALDDVSFDVQRGQVLGIVGPNGAGKTTLLRVLAGITPPSSGSAVVRGRVGALLEVGTGFHPELSGRENVYLGGAILGMRRHEIAARLEAIVDYAGVGEFIDEPLKHYSSGMQARLAFAIIAHLDPDILFVDEVLAVGDASFQAKSFAHMKGLAGRGVTVLFVSHNIVALSDFCDAGLLLLDGRARHVGPIGEVIARYRNALAERSTKHAAGTTALRAEIIVNGRPAGDRIACAPNDPLSVAVRLTTASTLYGAYLNLHVATSDGRPVLHLRSDLQHGPLMLGSGTHELTVSIDDLALAPGAYLMNFRLVSPDERSPLVWDSAVVVLEIEGHSPLDTFAWPRHRFEHRALSTSSAQR